jgi:hypothetical protein
MAASANYIIPPDPEIADVVNNCSLELNDFRSSEKMKVLFCRIAEASINIPPLATSWNHESIKRLDCWMRILINFLNVPLLSTLTGVGSYFNLPIAVRQQLQQFLVQRRITAKDATDYELVAALKYLLIQGLTLVKASERAIINTGQDDNFDKQRVEFLVNLLVFRLSSFVPWNVTMHEQCPVALKYLSCSILAVKGLSDDIIEAINKVNNSIRNALTGDEFTELLHNEKTDACASILRAHLTRYLHTIRSNSSRLIKYCRDNDVKSSLNQRIVAELKSENYESPRDVVRTFLRKYRQYLSNVPIPLQSLVVRDIKQAMKDIQRERMYINGDIYFGTSDSKNASIENSRSNEAKCDALERIVVLISTLVFGAEAVSDAGSVNLVGSNGPPAPETERQPKPTSVQSTKVPGSFPALSDDVAMAKSTQLSRQLSPETGAVSHELETGLFSTESKLAGFSLPPSVAECENVEADANANATPLGSASSHGSLFSLQSLSEAGNISVEHLVAFLSDDNGITPRPVGLDSAVSSGQIHSIQRYQSGNHSDYSNSADVSPRTIGSPVPGASYGDASPERSGTFNTLSVLGRDLFSSLEAANNTPAKTCTPGRSQSNSVTVRNTLEYLTGVQELVEVADVNECESVTTCTTAATGCNSEMPYSRSTSLSSANTHVSLDDDLTLPGVSHAVTSSAIAANKQQKLLEENHFKENLLKLLLNYVILAACRTTAGGDAFVLLGHLYGGEGLAFCPGRKKNDGSKGKGNEEDEYTTKIKISDDSITISLLDRYNLISMDERVRSEVPVLMSYVCTTTTQISLSAFIRPRTKSQENTVKAVDGHASIDAAVDMGALCRMMISNPESVCKQYVSIRPELPN